MEPERSLLFSHKPVTPANCPYPKTNPPHSQAFHVQNINLFLSSCLPLGFGGGLSPSAFAIIALCIFLFSTTPATRTTQLIFLDLFTLIMAISTNREAPQHVILSSPVLFPPCWVQILSSTPIAWPPSLRVHLIMWKAKFSTNTRQQRELQYFVL